MEDLSGLEWSQSTAPLTHKPPPMSTGNYHATLHPTPPLSGRSTPLDQSLSIGRGNTATNSRLSSKSSTPANDSFANLVSFGTLASARSLSLLEQQKITQEQRAKREAEQRNNLDVQFAAQTDFWDKLGDGRATPNRITSPPTYAGTDEYGGRKLSNAINRPFEAINGAPRSTPTSKTSETEYDLLSAFNAATPIDSSTDFPVPAAARATSNRSGATTPGVPSTLEDLALPSGGQATENYYDPFELGTVGTVKPTPDEPATTANDDDDVLGLLGRPVSELPPVHSGDLESSKSPATSQTSEPLDKAVAELIDMGFPPEKSRNALAGTESGIDVQAAVGILLGQAHEESRKKNSVQELRARSPSATAKDLSRRRTSRSNNRESDATIPAWMSQQSRSNSTQRHENSRSPANGEIDPSKYAAELGSNLFKTANSLWKTGTKKLNQAVSELNSDSDSSQPKWMRDAHTERQESRSRQTRLPEEFNGHNEKPVRPRQRRVPSITEPGMTDEALMLEASDTRPQRPETAQRPREYSSATLRSDSSREQSPAVSARFSETQVPQPRFLQQQQADGRDPRSRFSRQTIEEQSSQAYISPARRKKAPPNPPSPESNLLFNSTEQAFPAKSLKSQPKPAAISRPSMKPSEPLSSRLKIPKRTIPQVSPSDLQQSTTHRHAGTSAFKLGNYAQATSSYTISLSTLPAKHPLTIPLLTNRALTHLKTGDPKGSMHDADEAISVIGPSKGLGENVDSGGAEGSKPMSEFWGKAMTRKAEALEQLERWADASVVWKECVEAGVGGSASIQGRNRCEKAVGGRSSGAAPTAWRSSPGIKRMAPKPAPRISALEDLSGRSVSNTAASAEAVTRLRAANAEAERVDDEKFALADSVDERLDRWRKGKEGNLRALLGSLDTVLWDGVGWKKVGMSELVMPGKVKVIYMKGIGKVHPDKVCLPVQRLYRI